MDKRIALVMASLLSSALVYLPFIGNFDTIFRYYDGPLYVIVAQDFYDIQHNPFPELPKEYYSTVLLGYPLLIRLFSPVGFFNSMIFVTLVSSTLSTIVLYQILIEFGYVKNPVYISALSIFFPPRWLIYHSVGASEPVFVLFLLLSFYLFKKERFALSALTAAFATVTRLHGLVLLPTYALLMAREKRYRQIPQLLIIAAPLLLNFYLHSSAYGDMFVYFKWYTLTSIYPFSSVILHGEYRVFQYIIYALGIAILRSKKHSDLFTLALFLYLPLIFMQTRDFSRYLIPMAPFMLIAFEDYLNSKDFKTLLPLIFTLSYFYVWSIVPDNLASLEGFLKIKNSSY